MATLRVERLVGPLHDGRPLCPYPDALARMDALTARPRDADDVLLLTEHPPTITVGRKGGHALIHGRRLEGRDGASRDVEVYDVARGGSLTYHGPGQLVLYPIVQLPVLAGPIGRGPLGDLPRLVRELEAAMVATCAAFGLQTCTREGFSGVWIDERTKLASIGLGVRNGWTFHGLALNVQPRLEGFELITPCALDGVRMTSMRRELEQRGLPVPTYAAVERRLVAQLQQRLIRAPR